MKKMTMGILMALLAMTVSVYAQQAPNMDKAVARMQAQLNLTADQVTAIKPILQEVSSKRHEVMQNLKNGTIDKPTAHTQLLQITNDQKQKFSTILTTDQMTKWNQMRHRKHKPAPAPAAQ